MTAPANPPDLGLITELSHIESPHKSVVFTSGGSDLDLTATSAAGTASELYCTSTGSIIAVLAGDGTTNRTYPVTAGQVLKGVFTVIRSISTANCIARS